MQAPLAERMRPTKIDHLIGQEHLTGKGSILRASIDNAKIPSMIFEGAAGYRQNNHYQYYSEYFADSVLSIKRHKQWC